MIRYKADDRIKLTFGPEARNADGTIKLARNASVNYASKNSCWKQESW
jgi:hypothetical protein